MFCIGTLYNSTEWDVTLANNVACSGIGTLYNSTEWDVILTSNVVCSVLVHYTTALNGMSLWPVM